MFSFEKLAWDETTIGIDVAGLRELQAGETIAAATVEVLLNDTVQPAMLVSSQIVQTWIRCRVRGGEEGQYYRVRVRVTTNAGHQREQNILMYVKAG